MAKKEMIKSFVLRVDAETMEAIEKWAADEFRSTNEWTASMDYSGSFAQEWQNEEKEDNNQKRRNRMIQLF